MTTKNRAPIRLAESSNRPRLAATGSSSDGGRSASAAISRCASRRTMITAIAATAATGAWARKIERQSNSCVRTPPAAGPIAAPIAAAADQPCRGESPGRAAPANTGNDAASTRRAPHALHTAQRDEQVQRARGSATDRGETEDDQAGHQRWRRGQPPADGGDERRGDDEGQVVGHDHPGRMRDRRVEAVDDLRQRQHDDRRVGESQRHGQADPEVLPAARGSGAVGPVGQRIGGQAGHVPRLLQGQAPSLCRARGGRATARTRG